MFEKSSAQGKICLEGDVVLLFLLLSFDNFYRSTTYTKTAYEFDPNRSQMGPVWPRGGGEGVPDNQHKCKKTKEGKRKEPKSEQIRF